jgi:1-deoxy-D-xylulose-5-phosphate reductoisomerase
MSRLEFHSPDRDRFPCLDLAYRALRTGGTAPAVLNAANEVVVDAFLENGLPFHEIAEIIEATLNAHSLSDASTLESVLTADSWARNEARTLSRRSRPAGTPTVI